MMVEARNGGVYLYGLVLGRVLFRRHQVTKSPVRSFTRDLDSVDFTDIKDMD